MPRTSTPASRRKPRQKGKDLAVPAPPTIMRADANRLLRQRAQELFHQARADRDDRIRQFEGEFGRADRIDDQLLRDLQNLQVRFAAIGARQHRYGSNSEPAVSKYTKQLGDIIGALSAHLATERAMELFAPVEEREYVGFGGTIGRKGLDESILGGYAIVEETAGARDVTPTALNDEGQVCLHEEIEPIEGDPALGVCAECGEEFALDSRPESAT